MRAHFDRSKGSGPDRRLKTPIGIALLLLAFAGLARAEDPVSPVVLRGRTVFEIRAQNGAASTQDRARAAQAILEDVVANSETPASVTLDPLPETPGEPVESALRVDGREVLRIGPEDVARSKLSAEVYGHALQATLQSTLQRERRRAAQQRVLGSISMIVFLGLLAFLTLRWLTAAARRARTQVEERLTLMHGLRVRDFEVISPETLEGTSYALVGFARVALQVTVIYLYLIFALSRFAVTRAWLAPLNHGLATPFAQLLTRIGELLPVALIAVTGIFVVSGGLRVASFLLDRVARGEFQWSWLPKDLAPAARPLVRGAIVVGALLLFGPLVGSEVGQLVTHLGLLALGALALAAVPLAAAAGVGTLALFGRRYRVGEWLAIGELVGEVTEVGYFDLTLVPLEAGRVRVPHVVTLWTPIRHLSGPPAIEFEVPVDAAADPSKVMEALQGAFEGAKLLEVLLHRVTPGAVFYRLRFPPGSFASSPLATALAALAARGLSVGGRRD